MLKFTILYYSFNDIKLHEMEYSKGGMTMDVFLQEHGKTVFVAVCILLLVGVAYAVGPIIHNAVKSVVESYSTSVSFDSVAGKITTDQ